MKTPQVLILTILYYNYTVRHTQYDRLSEQQTAGLILLHSHDI